MGLLDSPLLLAAICALFYFGAGARDAGQNGHNLGVLWAGLSVLVSAITLIALHGSWGWLLAAQIALFFGIGVVRASRSP